MRYRPSIPAENDEAVVGRCGPPHCLAPWRRENRSHQMRLGTIDDDESVVRTLACSHGDRNDPASSDAVRPAKLQQSPENVAGAPPLPAPAQLRVLAPSFARSLGPTPGRRGSNDCRECRARRRYRVRRSPPDRWRPSGARGPARLLAPRERAAPRRRSPPVGCTNSTRARNRPGAAVRWITRSSGRTPTVTWPLASASARIPLHDR